MDPTPDIPTPSLLLGPMLRYVDEGQATIWVETSAPCEVVVLVDKGAGTGAATATFSEPTWTVHDHHFALVRIEGLTPGTVSPYRVALDAAEVWPPEDSRDSVIRTLSEGENTTPRAVRLAFGSCRRGEKQSPEMLSKIGADALVALSQSMEDKPHDRWPDAMLMLGDQIYADIPSERIAHRLADRRAAGLGPAAARASAGAGGDRDVSAEICDFEEYSWLYHESWSDPDVRWLLSSVPSCMILDDHDLRDDWNSSRFWRQEMSAQPWWDDRVAGAFASYFVYQHLGNLSPEELDADPTYQGLRALSTASEREALLDDLALRADAVPGTAKWSYHRDFGNVRVVMLDVRASRHLHQGDRLVMDESEWEWARKTCLEADGVDHLLIGSSLPAFMVPALHHLEGWNEATVELLGAAPLRSRFAEWLRRAVDLEHWAAFRRSFDQLVALLTEVARGDVGRAPSSILVLGGDVHCSYIEEVTLTDPSVAHSPTVVFQLVMSPYRNPLNLPIRAVNRLAQTRPVVAALRALAHQRGVRDPEVHWDISDGIWFDNGVMTIETEGRAVRVEVDHASVEWPDKAIGSAGGKRADGVDQPRQVLRRTLDKVLAGEGS